MDRMLGTRLVVLIVQIGVLVALTWSFRREVRKLAGRVRTGCPHCGYSTEGQVKAVCSECGRAISGSEYTKIEVARATPRFVGYGALQSLVQMFLGILLIRDVLEIRRVLMFEGNAFVPGYSLWEPQGAGLFVIVLLGIGIEIALAYVSMSLAMSGLEARKRAIHEVAAKLDAQFGSAHENAIR